MQGCLLLAAILLMACDQTRRHALRDLQNAGIEPSAAALLEAVHSNQAQHVRWMLDLGVFTESRDAQGRTPLRLAIEKRDVATAFMLLNAGANANSTAKDGSSVLTAAVQQAEIALVQKLIKAGAQTDAVMPDGEKILPWALREGRYSFAREMLADRADPHQTDRHGTPLLHLAIQRGRRDLVDLLIARGADASTRDSLGRTTLQLALYQGWHDAAHKLVAAGADPNACDVHGKLLLSEAVQNNNLLDVSFLLKLGADPYQSSSLGGESSPMDLVWENDRIDVLRIFLKQGVRPASGSWADELWVAHRHRATKLAQVIIQQGHRTPARNADGHSLIEAAALAANGSLVKLLLDYGFRTDRSLMLSMQAGDIGMVRLLLAAGADPNGDAAPFLSTPLIDALCNGHDEIAADFITHGARFIGQSHQGQSLFHLAVVTCSPQTVAKMLENGANANDPFKANASAGFVAYVRKGIMRWCLTRDSNVTPIMAAVDSGCLATAQILLDHGAKRQVWTRSSRLWPINFASRRSDVAMMRLVLGQDPHREERRIVISLSDQSAKLLDHSGNEIYRTRVSTGRRGFATPKGEFVITNKHRDWTSTIYHASMPYFQRLSCSDFGLHQGVVPGYPASHGCIRVPAGNAAKLFKLTQTGDRVMIIP